MNGRTASPLPAIALVLATGLTVWGAAQLPDLRWDGGLESVTLRDDPARIVNDLSQAAFGSDEVVLVVLPTDDITAPAYLQDVHDLTREFEHVQGVRRVASLTNYMATTGEDGALHVETVQERIASGMSPDALRELVSEDHFLVPNIVNEDQTATAITVRLAPTGEDLAEAKGLIIDHLRRLVDRPAQFAGWPVVQAEMSRLMIGDAMRLTPFVLGSVLALLWLGFRRSAAVFLPLTAIGFANAVTFGSLVASGRPITMVTNALSAVLIAMTSAYCVHVLAHLFRALEAELPPRKAVQSALRHTAKGVALSAITTSIGFGALWFNGVQAIDEFGFFAILGTLMAAVGALVVMPSVAWFLPLRAAKTKPPLLSALVRPASWLDFTMRHRAAILGTAVITLLISAWGWTRIVNETSPSTWFPPDHPARVDMEQVNETLVGTTPFNIVVPAPDGVLTGKTLDTLDTTASWLREQDGVSTVISMADPLADLAGRMTGERAVPTDDAAAAQYGFLWDPSNRPIAKALMQEEPPQANIILRTKFLASSPGVAFADRVQAWLDDNVPGAQITGSALLAYRTNLAFTAGLATSLGFGVLVLSVLMFALFRSAKTGLIAMVPNLTPIAINYALLGILGFSLDAGTAITGCIAMGIAVDDTIHLLLNYRDGLRRFPTKEHAMRYALDQVGPALVLTSLCLAAGFGALAFSQVQPIRSLGILVSITMIVCALCDLFLVPAMLVRGKARQDSAA